MQKLKNPIILIPLLIVFVLIGFLCIKRFILKRPPTTEVNPHDKPPPPEKIGGALASNKDSVEDAPKFITSEAPDRFRQSAKAQALGKGKPDRIPPAVGFISPISNSTIGGTVNIQIDATDNVGVASVSLTVDGGNTATKFSVPWTFSLVTTNYSNASHILTAVAKDAKGNAASASVTVTINNVTPPPPPCDTCNQTVTPPPNPPPTNFPGTFSISMPPMQNQGQYGSCVPFAVDYWQMSAEWYKKIGSSSYDFSTNVFSPDYMYKYAVSPYCNSGNGMSVIGAFSFELNNGSVRWATEPYNDQSCVKPSTSSEAANYRIKNYWEVYASDTTAIKTLIYTGHPLVFTFTPDFNFYFQHDYNASNPDYTTSLNTNYVWSWYAPITYGPHCVTLIGWDDSHHAYKIVNQWGVNWANGGYAWIDRTFFQKITYDLWTINF